MAGVIDWLRGRSEERALTRDNVSAVPAVMLGGSTVAGVAVNERTALGLADVFACVRAIAEAAATLPLIAYRRLPTGRERLPGGRLVSLLDRPAPAVTQSAFIGQLVASLAMRGNGFVGLYAGEEGQVEQLGVLPPDRVQVEIKGGMPLYTLTHDNGRQTTHGTDDVLHVRMPLTLDGILGASPIALQREALGLNRALGEEASALAANSSAPLGVLTVPAGPIEDEALENLRAGIESRHMGARNRGRVAVLTGDIKFAPISFSPHDGQLAEQRELSTAEVARIFRVPPWMIGAKSGDSLTYSTVEGQSRAFLVYTLQPYLSAVEQAITGHERLCPPGAYVEFMRAAILQADTLTRAQVYALALDPERGWMSRAEVRQRENLDPEPEHAMEAA
ncbi:MAG TPA: phage portal protein [Gaiellaceae bacterium]|nr:phage portal protein [Gaiellaceae bacterium]